MKPKITFLDKTKKRKLLKEFEKQYNITNLPYLIIQTGKDRYRIYSGSLSKEELNEMAKTTNIELIGTHLCKIQEGKIRLSFDILNTQEIKNQITKNIHEIKDDEVKKWMAGENLETEKEFATQYIIIKNQNNILGIGRKINNTIQNYTPKERRIRK